MFHTIYMDQFGWLSERGGQHFKFGWERGGYPERGRFPQKREGGVQPKNYAIENAKITKRSRAYEVYASTYNVEILKSFDSELQLKDTESTIKNKLKDLLSELRDFKFVTILVLEFKKIESGDKTQYSFFN